MTADRQYSPRDQQNRRYKNDPEFRARCIVRAKKRYANLPRPPCQECGKPIYPGGKFCRRCCRIGVRHQNWRGQKKDKRGYVLLHLSNHPFASREGYVPEHRVVMEAHLGRFLLPTEIVHHVNGILNDNRDENLSLFPSQAQHQSYHRRGRE